MTDNIIGKFWYSMDERVVHFPYSKGHGRYRTFLFVETSSWSIEKDFIEPGFIGPGNMYSNQLSKRQGIKLIFKAA